MEKVKRPLIEAWSIAILVTLVMLAVLVSTSIVSAHATVTVEIGSVANVTLGENTTTSITIKNVTTDDVGTITVNLTYDKSVVRVLNTTNSSFDFHDNEIRNDAGYTRIAAFQSENDGMTGDVELCDVILKAIRNPGEEPNPLNISIEELKNSSGGDIPCMVNNGTFTVRASEANWTFMVYLDGDNNLEGAGIDDMNEMEVAGSTSNVNIVVQFDRIAGYDSSNSDWTGTRRYYVAQDTSTAIINSYLVQDLGEVDMADPNVLANFVQWAMQNYSANNYALVLWNHGSGWKHQMGRGKPWEDGKLLHKSDPTKGIIWDDTSGRYLSMSELESALEMINTNTGETIDVLGFDACLMQMIEVAYQVKDYSSVVVGSEEVEPGDGWPYDTILLNLTSNPSMTPGELGNEIVADYIASYGTSGWETQSAVNQTKLPELATAVDNFAQVLNGSMSAYYNNIASARVRSESCLWDAEYIDLYHFAELVNSSVPDAEVQIRAAATAVMSNITNTVISEAHGLKHPDSHGLTIYFPTSQSSYLTSYENTDFANDTNWDEFLTRLYYYGASVIVPGADILLVDDDAGNLYEAYYKNALDANGYNYSYWNAANDGVPNTTLLADYSVVIWFTGDDYSTTLKSTEQENLQTYLNAGGGNLFISGQEIGYDIGNSSTFYTNYLHAQYVADDSNLTTLTGISGDPVGDGLTIGISGGDGANNQNYPSNVTPYGTYASAVFNYTGDGCGAVRADTTTYKVVYFAFGFEGINSSDDRNTVMDRVISWFLRPTITIGDISAAPDHTTSAPITITNVNDIGRIDVNLTYDPDVVVVINATSTPFDVTTNNLNYNASGWVRIAGNQTTSPGLNSSSITLSTLTFKAVGNGGESTTLTISVNSMAYSDDTPIAIYVVNNGTFTVGTKGDASGDGEVDSWDCTCIARYLAGIEGYQTINTAMAEISGDGVLDSWDCTYLARHLAGIGGIYGTLH